MPHFYALVKMWLFYSTFKAKTAILSRGARLPQEGTVQGKNRSDNEVIADANKVLTKIRQKTNEKNLYPGPVLPFIASLEFPENYARRLSRILHTQGFMKLKRGGKRGQSFTEVKPTGKVTRV